MKTSLTGKCKDIERIRIANRATTVGRLMLGEIKSWEEFLRADTAELESIPRRILKSGVYDVKKNVSKEIKKFCSRNFEGLTEQKLNLLYEEIKAKRGLEIPLIDFEREYALPKKDILKDAPPHCTVVFSLWGLQFRFPEDYLTKDIVEALREAIDSDMELKNYQSSAHSSHLLKRDDIAALIRKGEHAKRSCLISCFNLIESYLNGIAWDFAQNQDNLDKLSNKDKKRILDSGQINLREKLLKYPRIITQERLWSESDEPIKEFLELFKPFRDSLVHPSPFSAPDKFGGYNKLRLFYGLNTGIVMLTAKTITEIIIQIDKHINGSISNLPDWLSPLTYLLDEWEFKMD